MTQVFKFHSISSLTPKPYLAFNGFFIAKVFFKLFMQMYVAHGQLLGLEFVKLFVVYLYPQWFLGVGWVKGFKL